MPNKGTERCSSSIKLKKKKNDFTKMVPLFSYQIGKDIKIIVHVILVTMWQTYCCDTVLVVMYIYTALQGRMDSMHQEIYTFSYPFIQKLYRNSS